VEGVRLLVVSEMMDGFYCLVDCFAHRFYGELHAIITRAEFCNDPMSSIPSIDMEMTLTA
jgi:hypothetical protein